MTYNPSLDGFRAIAVSIVVFAHLFPSEIYPYTGFHYGRLGVIAFFVLSGFLITNILLGYRSQIETGALSLGGAWKKFLVRRTLRIFPLYFGVLLVFGFMLGYERLREDFWWHAAYVSNFGQAIQDKNFGAANHFWSLCVEEQFYLVWPAILLLVPRHRSHALVVAVLAVSFLAGCLWVALDTTLKFAGYVPVGGSSLALATGAWLACRTGSRIDLARPLQHALIAAGVGLLSVAIVNIHTFSHTMLQLVTDVSWTLISVWIILQLHNHQGRFLAFKPIVWLGKISYGIYIYHLLLSIYFVQLTSRLHIDRADFPLLTFFVEVCFVIFVSAISYHFFEEKFLRLKSRLGG